MEPEDFFINTKRKQLKKIDKSYLESEIDDLIYNLNNKLNLDDIVNLLTLKKLKKKIASNFLIKKSYKEEFELITNTINFKEDDKNKIMSSTKIMNNLMLEFITNPQKMKFGVFHFKNLMSKFGENTAVMFCFLIQNMFNEIKMFKRKFFDYSSENRENLIIEIGNIIESTLENLIINHKDNLEENKVSKIKVIENEKGNFKSFEFENGTQLFIPTPTKSLEQKKSKFKLYFF